MTMLAGRLRWLAQGFETEYSEYLRSALFLVRQAQLAYFILAAAYINALLVCRSVTLEVVLVALLFPSGSPIGSISVYVAAFFGGLIAILILAATFELLASIVCGREMLELKRADCHPNGMNGRLIYAAILATKEEEGVDGEDFALGEDTCVIPLSAALSEGADAAFVRAKRGARIAQPARLRQRAQAGRERNSQQAREQHEDRDRTSAALRDLSAAAGPAASPIEPRPIRGRRMSVVGPRITPHEVRKAQTAGWQVRVGCWWWDWLMQLFIHVGLELGPLLTGIAVNVSSGRASAGLSAYVVTGGLLATLITWLYMLVILGQITVFLVALAMDNCCCCCAEAFCDLLTSPAQTDWYCWLHLLDGACYRCGCSQKVQALDSNSQSSTSAASRPGANATRSDNDSARGPSVGDAEMAQPMSDPVAPVPASEGSQAVILETGLQQPGIVQSNSAPTICSLKAAAVCLACWFDGGPLTSREHIAWLLSAKERTRLQIERRFDERAAGYSTGMLGYQWHEHLCFSIYKEVLSPDVKRDVAQRYNPSRSLVPGAVAAVTGACVFVGLLLSVSLGLAVLAALAITLLIYALTGWALGYCGGSSTSEVPQEMVSTRIGHTVVAHDSSTAATEPSQTNVASRLGGEELLPWVSHLQTACFYMCCCCCPRETHPHRERQSANGEEANTTSTLESEWIPCCGIGCRLAFMTPRHALSWCLCIASVVVISAGGWIALGLENEIRNDRDQISSDQSKEGVSSIVPGELTAMGFILGGLVVFALDLLWISTCLPHSVSSVIPGRLGGDVREMQVAVMATFLSMFVIVLSFMCTACGPIFQIIAVIAALVLLWRMYLLYDSATGRFSTAPWLAAVRQSHSLTRVAMAYSFLFGEPWAVSNDTLQLLVRYAKMDLGHVSISSARQAHAAAGQHTGPLSVNPGLSDRGIAGTFSSLGTDSGAEGVDTNAITTSGRTTRLAKGGVEACGDGVGEPVHPSSAWTSPRHDQVDAVLGDGDIGVTGENSYIEVAGDVSTTGSSRTRGAVQQPDVKLQPQLKRRMPEMARRLLPGLRSLVGSWETTSQMAWQNTPGFVHILEASMSPVPRATGAIAGAGIALGVGLFILLLVGSIVVTDQLQQAMDQPLHGNMTSKPGEARLGRRFTACDTRMDKGSHLGVVDSILASQLAYRTSEAAFDSDFEAWFREPQAEAEWSLRRRINETAEESVEIDGQPQSVVRYFAADSVPWGVHLIGVRGTTVGRDVVANLDIFAEGALLDAVFALLPGGSFVESDWKAWMAARVARITSPLRAIGVDDNIVGLERFVDDLAKEDAATSRSMDTVIVGHSLGGAVALLVAARQDVRAIGVSPPGLGMTRGKFGVSLEALQRHGYAVHPTHDWVSLIDERVVPSQGWPCDLQEWGTHGCHMLDAPWELFSNTCGDVYGRTMLATTG